MADILQELVVAIGLDTSGLRGLSQAVSTVAGAVNSSTAKVNADAKQTADAFERAADAGRETAEKIKQSWGSLTPAIDRVKKSVKELVGALAAATVAKNLFSTYIDQGDKLTNLSRQLGISEREIDAWSKANQAAGGSAEALQSSLKAFYDSTGRPATEFFKLGEKIEGMSKRQASAFLRAQGVAWDAIPVFLNGQKAADELVAKYRKTAFTAQDARNASNFKTAWMDFRIAVQGVGNTLLRLFVPAMTKVLGVLEAMVDHVRENIQFFSALGGAVAIAFAVKNIEAIKAAAVAVKAFGLSVKGALLPLTLIVAAVAAAAMAFDDLMTFAEGGDSIFGRLLEGLGMTSDEIDGLRKSLQSIGEAFGKAWDAAKPFVKGVLSFALKALAGLAAILIGLMAALTVGIRKCVDWAIAFGRDCVDAFNAAIDAVTGFFSGIGDAIESAFDGVTGIVKATFIDPLVKAVDYLAKVFGSIGGAIETAFAGISDFFISAFDGLTSIVKAAFGAWWSFGKSLFIDPFVKGVESFAEVFRSIGDAIESAFDGVTNIVKALFGTWWEFGKALFLDPLVNGIESLTEVFGGIGDAIESAFDGVTGFIKSVFESWSDLGKALFLDPFKNAIKSLFNGVKSFFGFKTDGGDEAIPRERQSVMEQRARGAGNQITTHSAINVTNNIMTKDDPGAIGAAVGQTVQGGAGRLNDLTAQTMRGVSLK